MKSEGTMAPGPPGEHAYVLLASGHCPTKI